LWEGWATIEVGEVPAVKGEEKMLVKLPESSLTRIPVTPFTEGTVTYNAWLAPPDNETELHPDSMTNSSPGSKVRNAFIHTIEFLSGSAAGRV
jgi:hypothetical protein